MLSKSLKWELGLVHYIAKFTISRFVISKFECTSNIMRIWYTKIDVPYGVSVPNDIYQNPYCIIVIMSNILF